MSTPIIVAVLGTTMARAIMAVVKQRTAMNPPITAPTMFTLVAGNACSDASVQPFTMQIAPDVSTGEITVITASGPSVSFRANYVSVGKSSPINMTLLHTDQNGHKTTYVIDSGRPIIRNDPRRPFNRVYVIAGILVLAAALIYLLSR